MSQNLKYEPEPPKVQVLCFDLSKQTKTVQFLLCSAAVFVFFLLYGYMQELIFTVPGFQPYGWYLTLVQFGLYSVYGLTEKYASRISSRK